VKTFTEIDLRTVYAAVGHARPRAFSGRHGPLEATAWLHLTIGDLERLDDALDAMTLGNDQALAILRSLGKYEKPLAVGGPDDFDEDELERAPFGIADPVALAVAVHMVASHGDEASAERLLWYAVRRTAAVNLAFEVAERYSAGWFSASYFESRMRIASPLAVDAGAVAGHGSGGHTHNHHGTAPNHHDTAPSLATATSTTRGASAWTMSR
jgi:hypothetical protein